MKVYTKSWNITLPISLTSAWNFFSNPENLNKITPAEMNFVIHTDLKNKNMYEGMFINYTVSPLLNLPMHWTTEITYIKPNEYFVDEQRNGPYRIWHHEHHFKEIAGGVEMRDILNYALPFGYLGHLANQFFIDKKIESIFAYRSAVLKSMFV